LTARVQQPLAIGQKMPNFKSVTISGDTIELAQYKGKIVLIDCWASWNIPSRKHNLSTKRLYEKYRAISLRKKQKFIVVQISLDTREDLLRNAISKDNLYWRAHICDYKGWKSKYVGLFNINSIPTNYLIDTAGIIVAKNIWETQLDERLQSLIQ
jgi:peroxiredoxin